MFTFIIADACANVNQIFVKPMRPQIKYTKDSGRVFDTCTII